MRHCVSPVNDYWLLKAINQAAQGKNLERELAQAQDLTEQYLACVRGGGQPGLCAQQVDPDYQGAGAQPR